MNIILLQPEEICGNQVTLADGRAEHLVKVLRAELGDSLTVGVVDGNMGTGTITDIQRRRPFSAVLTVQLETLPPPLPLLDLVLALPRPIMFRRILSQATSLGVGSFHVINARRVEKSFWDAGTCRPERCLPHLLKGLEQAVDTRLPRLFFHRSFKTFIDRELPAISAGYRAMMVADPRYRERLPEMLAGDRGRLLLAVGPEGGWVEYELDRLGDAGFQGFGMGPRIVRVDTAVVALMGMIMMLNR